MIAPVWAELRAAVREAVAIGCEFRIVGADVEIDGEIPDDLRARLPASLLWQYLGASWDDQCAIEFLGKLGVRAVLVRDIEGARAALKALSRSDLIGIDIETKSPKRPPPVRINRDGRISAKQAKAGKDGLDPLSAGIATLQLYGGGDECFVFVGEALDLMLGPGADWLRERHLVAHNAGFETRFLRHHARAMNGAALKTHPFECAMQAGGLLNGAQRRGLDDVCSAMLGMVPPKDLQTSCWGAARHSPGQIAYAASDSILAYRLWRRQQPALVREGLIDAYRLQRDAIAPVAEMELRGLGFDREEHARQVEGWSRDLADARSRFADIAGRPPPANLGQVREWLAPHVDGTWPRTEKGLLSAAQDDLARLVLREDISEIKPLIELRAIETLLQNFGPTLAAQVNPVTGRIHASYNIAAAKPGRFTCSVPNLQQLPAARAPEFRKVVVPAPGNVLVGGDYGQVELRAAAWLYRDPEMTAAYAEGRDLHRETAAAIAGVPIELVTPEQRNAAKAINFCSIYGGGPATLAVSAFTDYGIDMTEAEATAALDRFFRKYHVMRRRRFDDWNRVKRTGSIRIGCGRRVRAEWEPSGQLRFTQSCNLPVQGIAADCMLRAITKLHGRMPGAMVCTVHDELLLEVPEDGAAAAAVVLAEVMIAAFVETFPGAPTLGLVDVHVGKNWKEAKG
jgi:DNA polymerase-1